MSICPKACSTAWRQTYTLSTNDQLLTAEQYDNLIIAYRNGAPVRISDVGHAISAPENDLVAGWHNEQRAIILGIQRQPGRTSSRRSTASKPCCRRSRRRSRLLVKVSIISDRTETIRASVADVQFTLLLTVALVVMVIFLFLRNFWAMVIPAVTVPLSLIGTFAVLYEFGYSLDNLAHGVIDRGRLRRRRCRRGDREHRTAYGGEVRRRSRRRSRASMRSVSLSSRSPFRSSQSSFRCS